MFSQPTIKINTAADVLDIVPALLNFYPTESLVAMILEDTPTGGRVAVTARFDLPTTTDEKQDAADSLAMFLRRYDRAALVVYSVDQHAARTVLADLLRGTDPNLIHAALIAFPEGWTHLEPTQPDAVMWTNPYTPGTGAAAAAATAAGLIAQPQTRGDIRDSIAAPDPASAAAWHDAYQAQQIPVHPSEAQAAAIATEVVATVVDYLAQPYTLTTDEVAFLVARVQDFRPRDAAWLIMDRASAAGHTELWKQVAALTPDVTAVLPVLALLGSAGWISGQGVLTSLALDRAHQIPGGTGYSMLSLLRSVVDNAVPPSMWDDLRRDVL